MDGFAFFSKLLDLIVWAVVGFFGLGLLGLALDARKARAQAAAQNQVKPHRSTTTVDTDMTPEESMRKRLTIDLPLWTSLALMLYIAYSYNNLLGNLGQTRVPDLAIMVIFLPVLYFLALRFRNRKMNSRPRQLSLGIACTGALVGIPLLVAIFAGAVLSSEGNSLWMLLYFVCTVALATAGAAACGVAVSVMLRWVLQLIWWLLGSPPHPEMNKVAESSNGGQDGQQYGGNVAGNIEGQGPGSGPVETNSAPVPAHSGDDKGTPASPVDFKRPKLKLDSLSGMTQVKEEITRSIAPFAAYAQGKGIISDRNGILLSGPPGNGKTVFAEAIAGELGLPLLKASCQVMTSMWINDSGQQVKNLFDFACSTPCVLFLDEFDSVARSREAFNMHNEDMKVVAALLTEIDNVRSKRVVLVAATNYADRLDAAVCRDGRFDFRIEIPYPDLEARIGILRGMLTKFKVGADDATVKHVAALWVRRSVAFIEATVKRLRDDGKGTWLRKASVEDFKLASRQASRRASAIPSEGAKLSELALTSNVRRETDSLVYRLRHWEDIAERGGEPPSGVLLYGPPGTGKTNLVRALARELEYWHVFEVSAADVLQDPRKFRETMELAATHRPAIVFIDEADELLKERSYSNATAATNEILKAMDGMMGTIPEIVFMAATNNAELMDAAALRGGRFSEKIFMGRLTGDDLVAFLEKDFASKSKVQFDPDLTPVSLAARLQETAPADALGLLRKAINYTFGQDGSARAVCMADIEKAIETTQL